MDKEQKVIEKQENAMNYLENYRALKIIQKEIEKVDKPKGLSKEKEIDLERLRKKEKEKKETIKNIKNKPSLIQIKKIEKAVDSGEFDATKRKQKALPSDFKGRERGDVGKEKKERKRKLKEAYKKRAKKEGMSFKEFMIRGDKEKVSLRKEVREKFYEKEKNKKRGGSKK